MLFKLTFFLAIAFIAALQLNAFPASKDDHPNLIRKAFTNEKSFNELLPNLNRRDDDDFYIQLCDAFDFCSSPLHDFQNVCYSEQGKTKIKVHKPSETILLGTYCIATYSSSDCSSESKIDCQNLGISGITGTATIDINNPGFYYKIVVSGPFKKRNGLDQSENSSFEKRQDCGV